MKKNIDELVKKIIKESLEGKVDELEDKIDLEEWDQEPTISAQPGDIAEDDVEDSNDDYIMDKLKRECGDNPDSESCKKHKKYAGMDTEMDEELHGGQKKLDKNKNGRLDKKDFEILRGDVEEGFGDFFDDNYEDIHDYLSSDDSERFHPIVDKKEKDTAFSRMRRGYEPEDIDFEEMEEGNAFTDKLRKTPKGGKFELGGKSYTDRSNLEEAEKFIQKAMKKMEKKGTEGSFKEYCGGEVTKSCIDKAMKSGDSKLIKKANFAKNIKAYEGAKHNKKSVKESLQLTESEMIDLIEKIVMEQKKAKGMAETEKVQNASKKENDAAMKEVSKKMKEYVKGGSKGEYTENPKHFPKGNGELAKMDKMAYKPNDNTEEYIENFTAAGLENLVYDEIHPDDKWVDDNVEGSSRTGNNPEWANAVDSGVNKKRNKIRKDNLLGAVKAMAYNKAPQPVTDDTKSGPAGKFHRNFGKDAGKKATKILNQLESTNEKSEKLISEEFDKMKHLIGYNKKTQ